MALIVRAAAAAELAEIDAGLRELGPRIAMRHPGELVSERAPAVP